MKFSNLYSNIAENEWVIYSKELTDECSFEKWFDICKK